MLSVVVTRLAKANVLEVVPKKGIISTCAIVPRNYVNIFNQVASKILERSGTCPQISISKVWTHFLS